MPACRYEFYLPGVQSTSHEWAALTCEISSWTLEDKIYIHARSCNILYISYILFCFLPTVNFYFLVVLHPFLSRSCAVWSVIHTHWYSGPGYHITYYCSCACGHFLSFVHEKCRWNLEGMLFIPTYIHRLIKSGQGTVQRQTFFFKQNLPYLDPSYLVLLPSFQILFYYCLWRGGVGCLAIDKKRCLLFFLLAGLEYKWDHERWIWADNCCRILRYCVVYINKSLHLTQKYVRMFVCGHYNVSVPRSEQFSESVASRNR